MSAAQSITTQGVSHTHAVRVVARTQDGKRYSYTLATRSTWDALDAALERFGPELARCSVRPTTVQEAANA